MLIWPRLLSVLVILFFRLSLPPVIICVSFPSCDFRNKTNFSLIFYVLAPKVWKIAQKNFPVLDFFYETNTRMSAETTLPPSPRNVFLEMVLLGWDGFAFISFLLCFFWMVANDRCLLVSVPICFVGLKFCSKGCFVIYNVSVVFLLWIEVLEPF